MAQGDTDPPAVASARRVRVWHAGLTPASAALIVGAVVTAFVLRNMFVEAHRIVGWVVACSIVALLIDPLVDIVDRVLPRWISVIVVLLGVVAIIGRESRSASPTICSTPSTNCRRRRPRPPPGWRSSSTGPWTSASATGCKRSSTS